MRFSKLLSFLAAVALAPWPALAHPHIWIQQVVRVVAKDGKFTHVELEWRFDPFSSEIEIPLIDENGDGRFSPAEVKTLAGEMLPELKKVGYLTWLTIAGKDVRPPKPPVLQARIDDPATFVPPEWDRSAGDQGTMQMPANKRATEPAPPRKRGPRNLVYVMRFALPEAAGTFAVATLDPDDFIRVEVDKATLPPHCRLSKHPTVKSEFVRGYPFFADLVTCHLP